MAATPTRARRLGELPLTHATAVRAVIAGLALARQRPPAPAGEGRKELPRDVALVRDAAEDRAALTLTTSTIGTRGWIDESIDDGRPRLSGTQGVRFVDPARCPNPAVTVRAIDVPACGGERREPPSCASVWSTWSS